MEHFSDIITSIKEKTGITGNVTLDKLITYAELIHSENMKYNLTGHKTIEDIINNLITGSISPLNLENVPRGTSVADMGTGAGIPGIPLAIRYPELNFTLFDSTAKKINFIEMAAENLGLENIKAVCARIEDVAKDKKYREVFDLVMSRAMSDVYMAGELCSQFIKVNGYLYLYVSERQKQIDEAVSKHLSKLNLSITDTSDTCVVKFTEGLLLKKTGKTADTYPRRITVIKRGISEIEKITD